MAATTTILNIISRATAFSTANDALTVSTNYAACASRIAADERLVLQKGIAASREYFTLRSPLTVAGSGPNRTVSLSALDATRPVVRVLRLSFADDTEVRQVDSVDRGAITNVPTFHRTGQTLRESGSGWASQTTLTLEYAAGPTPIDLASTTVQNTVLTLDNEFCDLLVLRLAHFFALHDFGREQAERDALAAMIKERDDSFIETLRSGGGMAAMRWAAAAGPGVRA